MNKISAMKYMVMAVLVGVFSLNAAMAKGLRVNKPDDISILGRWDITIMEEGKQSFSWLEVQHSGNNTLVGRFVAAGGSARPVSRINFSDGKISFSLPPQWEQGKNDLSFEGSLQGQSLAGTLTYPNGKTAEWTAVRAPSLMRTAAPVWGKPVQLFNGKDITGWHTEGANQWVVENGVLKSPKSGSNLLSDQAFTDFKLHIEFRYPKGSNSGVYLRGRYEVQVEDDEPGQAAAEQLGAIYGFIAASESAGTGYGTWQSYDITLTGRMVTVILNGKTIICNREIPGITGGAINNREGEPGPLMIQGDHGPIEYRNIVITPAE
ncbi:MAG: DUF1080 domain-containing protein [Panacibacter sp.]